MYIESPPYTFYEKEYFPSVRISFVNKSMDYDLD